MADSTPNFFSVAENDDTNHGNLENVGSTKNLSAEAAVPEPFDGCYLKATTKTVTKRGLVVTIDCKNITWENLEKIDFIFGVPDIFDKFINDTVREAGYDPDTTPFTMNIDHYALKGHGFFYKKYEDKTHGDAIQDMMERVSDPRRPCSLDRPFNTVFNVITGPGSEIQKDKM